MRDYPLETLQRHILLGYLQALYSVISAGINGDFSTERGARVIKARVERNMAVLEDHDVSQVLSA